MPLLEVERLSKGFGGVRAVNDVSFALDEGELLGIMGPNGSGKTTLFNLIAGALLPDAGHIRLAGRDIAGRPAHEACAAGVARTFQLVRPFAGLTALENVLVGRLYGRARTTTAEAVTEARRLLRVLGLEARADEPAARLTLIDRKRLELARALATSPRLLLLDEFMAGLNPMETATAKIVVQYWFRFSAGSTPYNGGTKWLEGYVRAGTYRWQTGIDQYTGGGWNPYVIAPPAATQGEVFVFNNSGSPTDANGHTHQAEQPVGPWISDINDGNWHRYTAMFQAASSSGAGDGMVRVWIDGTKIMDLSASAVGVTPPGGLKPWCYAGETVTIPAEPIGFLQLPGVANNISGTLYTLDHDDLVIWKQSN